MRTPNKKNRPQFVKVESLVNANLDCVGHPIFLREKLTGLGFKIEITYPELDLKVYPKKESIKKLDKKTTNKSKSDI